MLSSIDSTNIHWATSRGWHCTNCWAQNPNMSQSLKSPRRSLPPGITGKEWNYKTLQRNKSKLREPREGGKWDFCRHLIPCGTELSLFYKWRIREIKWRTHDGEREGELVGSQVQGLENTKVGRPASPPNFFPEILGIFAFSIFLFLQGIIIKGNPPFFTVFSRDWIWAQKKGNGKWLRAILICELEGWYPSRSCLSFPNWDWSHATLPSLSSWLLATSPELTGLF